MMRWKSWLLALGLGAWFATGPAWADPPPGYPFVSFDQGLRQAKQQNRPIFLYFGRFGCGWCDMVNKQAFSNQELHDLYVKDFVLVYVDAESGKRLRLPSGERITEADLGVRYKAFATPLFIYMDADGQELARVPGVKTIADFRDYDRYVAEGHYKTQTLMQFLAGKP
jgi:thioredoxin-related protein